MVEELAEVPYHLQHSDVRARVARDDGSWEELTTRLHLWHWARDFAQVGPILQASGAQRTGPVGQATCLLVDARAMRDLLVPLLHRDPLLLLAPHARAEYEQSRAAVKR
jgi:hypothetical protein